MAVIVVVNSSSSIGGANNYIANSSKTTITTTTGEQKQLITGINCNPKTATQEMNTTKEMFGKTGGRTYKHYVQSFHPDDPITPEKAHEIGKEWVDNSQFAGHEILMTTHTDTDHIHNHFILNSVNFENGRKYQESKEDYERLLERSNKLSKKYGLSIPEKSKNITANNSRKYRAIERHYNPNDDYTSDIVETADTVLECKSQATSWDNFLQLMNQKNYNVKWKSPKTGKDYKYVTYTHPNGAKFRCKNINNTFKIEVGKEQIINATSKQQQPREQANNRARNRGDRGTVNVDWGAIESSHNNQKDRTSEQFGNEITRSIQREIREVEEEVARATGEQQPEDRPETREDRTETREDRTDDRTEIKKDREENREIEDSQSKSRKEDKPRNQGFER